MPDLFVSKKTLMHHWSQVLDNTHWSEGRYVRAFEREVADWSGQHAVAFANAGVGLFAIMRCLEDKGEDVLVQNNTFFATGAMVKEAGYRPVLVDCRRDDFSMDFLAMTTHSSPSVSAVILTHVGGMLAIDYNSIATWCKQGNVPLIEDAAHVLGVGSGARGTCAGTFGYAAVFSLYPTKAIPAGEGGVVITRDREFAEKLRRFRNYGKSIGVDRVVQYDGVGFNLRMDEFTAVVAWLQMTERTNLIDRRADIVEKLKHVAPPLTKRASMTNHYKYIVSADVPATRTAGKVYAATDQLHNSLLKMDAKSVSIALPNCQWIADNHKCLPIEPGMEKMSIAKLTDYILR